MKYTISFLFLLSLIVLATCGGVHNHNHHEDDKPAPDGVKGVVPVAGGKGADEGKGKEDGKTGGDVGGKTGSSSEGDDSKESQGAGDDKEKVRDRRGYILGYGHYAPAYGLGYHGYYRGLGYHGLGYHGLGWHYGYHG